MLSKALEALPEGSYVRARTVGDGLETVRLLGVREPTDRELRYGHTSKRVWIRRFMLAGWRDTWVLPRDVVEVADPSPSVLAMIDYCEREVGPISERRA